MQSEVWDGVVEHWAETHPQPLWRTHSDAVNARLLDRWLPAHPVQRLLKTDLFDEAVSEGLYPLLVTRTAKVTGIDISERVVQAAAARYPRLEAIQADIRALPFSTATFDVVVSLSTLDHFRAPEQLAEGLAELHRILCPGGLLVLTLDNQANPIVALRNALPFPLLKRWGLIPYYVGATYGPRGTRRVLQEAGFQVQECDAVLHVPRIAAVAVARLMKEYATPRMQHAFIRLLMKFEALKHWPTRFLTGYFVAVRAIKLSEADS